MKERTSRPHYPHRAVGKRPFPARPSYREIRDSEAAEAYQTTKTSKKRRYTAAERGFRQRFPYNDEKIPTSAVRPRRHAHRPDGGHHPFGTIRPAAFRYRSERPTRALPLHRTAVRGVLPDILRLRRPPDQRSRSRITGEFHRKRHLRSQAADIRSASPRRSPGYSPSGSSTTSASPPISPSSAAQDWTARCRRRPM